MSDNQTRTDVVMLGMGPVAERIRAQATDSFDDPVAVERFIGKGETFIGGRGRLVTANDDYAYPTFHRGIEDTLGQLA